MRTLNDLAARPSQVTALYDDAARSFRLPEGATLSDLAEKLAWIEAINGRKPLSVGVTFDA